MNDANVAENLINPCNLWTIFTRLANLLDKQSARLA